MNSGGGVSSGAAKAVDAGVGVIASAAEVGEAALGCRVQRNAQRLHLRRAVDIADHHSRKRRGRGGVVDVGGGGDAADRGRIVDRGRRQNRGGGALQTEVVRCKVAKAGGAIPVGIGLDIKRKDIAAGRISGVSRDCHSAGSIGVERNLQGQGCDGKAGNAAIDVAAAQSDGERRVLGARRAGGCWSG